VIAVIGAAYAYGLRSGRLPKRMMNPANAMVKFREQVRERFLSESELLKNPQASPEESMIDAGRMKNNEKPDTQVTKCFL
jgi:hypothetical protein